MVYVGDKSFQTDFKNISLPGYYDKIGPSVYIRRQLSSPGRKVVYCYKLEGRWCIGPQLGHTRTWAYSATTNKPPTGKIAWYENINGEAGERSKTIKVYQTTNG